MRCRPCGAPKNYGEKCEYCQSQYEARGKSELDSLMRQAAAAQCDMARQSELQKRGLQNHPGYYWRGGFTALGGIF